MTQPRRALLALLLLVPAASIGTLAGLSWGPGTLWGQGLYFFCKLYLLAFPACWLLLVDRQKPAFARPSRRGIVVGLSLGIVIAAAILGAYAIIAHNHWLNPAALKSLAAKNRLTTPIIYLAFALWTTFINALLEEYVWRWFITEKCLQLVSPQLPPSTQTSPCHRATLSPCHAASAALAALCFTLHHTLVLSLYFQPALVLLASAGVFLGGLLWSALYLRFRSIIPAYLAHIPADIAIFTVGYALIFHA